MLCEVEWFGTDSRTNSKYYQLSNEVDTRVEIDKNIPDVGGIVGAPVGSGVIIAQPQFPERSCNIEHSVPVSCPEPARFCAFSQVTVWPMISSFGSVTVPPFGQMLQKASNGSVGLGVGTGVGSARAFVRGSKRFCWRKRKRSRNEWVRLRRKKLFHIHDFCTKRSTIQLADDPNQIRNIPGVGFGVGTGVGSGVGGSVGSEVGNGCSVHSHRF